MSSGGGETTAERFRRLEPLLDRALELEGKAQDDFIASCAAIYPDLIDDLRRAPARALAHPAAPGRALDRAW